MAAVLGQNLVKILIPATNERHEQKITYKNCPRLKSGTPKNRNRNTSIKLVSGFNLTIKSVTPCNIDRG
jgi:hypothetical protein